MSRFDAELLARLREHGYQARITSIEHLHLLQTQIDEQRGHELLSQEFYQSRLARIFSFQIPETLLDAQSLIVVAVPRPQTRATFTCNGYQRSLILPPTYTAYKDTKKQVENSIVDILGEEGYRATGTELPLKLLATRSGLAEYGKNNICYVSGMGSFLQLVATYSNMPCEEDSWQEAGVMQTCKDCELCRRACPTGAIPSDRFLLRAERCITYHNEKRGDIPFPSWMDVTWHNCLIGCMRCQRACPLNKQFLGWIDGEEEEFSEKETALILDGASRDKLPEETIRKLEHLDILDDLGILPRNLSVFFRRHK